MNTLTGQDIGRYHIVEQLGEGGMATVYRAYDTRLDRDVAIKFIRREAVSMEQVGAMLQRFEREARSLAKLSHPNIVQVHDYGEHDGSPYLVLAFVNGGTLKDRMGSPFPYPEAARLLLPVVRALDYAHRQKIIHRDVKPANILITTDGDPLLSDFGIAKIIEVEGVPSLTGTGVSIGTPEYMSPEQAMGQPVDNRTDIYALGIVFYEMVTGRKPFTADTPLAVIFKHVTDPLPRPRDFVPGLPEIVEQVIFKALAKRPEDRFQSMAEFAAALEKLVTGYSQPLADTQATLVSGTPPAPLVEISAPMPTAGTPAARQVQHPGLPERQPVTPVASPQRGLSPWLWAGGVFVLLVLGVGLVGVFLASGLIHLPTAGGIDQPVATAVAQTEAAQPPPAEVLPLPNNEDIYTPVTPLPEAPFEGLVISAPNCDYGGVLAEIAAVDRYTVHFTLCKPEPAFREKLAHPAFGILPSEAIEKNGGAGDLLMHPIGSGPYRFQEWRKGDRITLKANADYWGDKPGSDTLTFDWNEAFEMRLTSLLAGVADGIAIQPWEDTTPLHSDSGPRLITREGLNTFYIGMNNTYQPFDKPEVRQAIAIGIDRNALVELSFPPGSSVASHFVPCFLPFGCAGEPWPVFDPLKARQLLADAGLPDGFETTIYYRDVPRNYLPQPERTAQVLQEQLQVNLNIRARLQPLESGKFINSWSKGELNGLHLIGWQADILHANDFVGSVFKPNSRDLGNLDEALVNIAQEALGAMEPEALYVRFNETLVHTAPLVPVAHGAVMAAYLPGVAEAHVSLMSTERFAMMNAGGGSSFTFMQIAEPPSLYCLDESGSEAMRICAQVTEPLYRYRVDEPVVEPALAEICEPQGDRNWVCHLRHGVRFHDGSTLDANDVVMTLGTAWDARSPLHKGNRGDFSLFAWLWGVIGK